jgi:hypothetical protein
MFGMVLAFLYGRAVRNSTDTHPTIEGPMRRIVLEHTTGRYAGLRQILGTDVELKKTHGELPNEVEDVDFLDHSGSCVLLKSRHRFHHYIERKGA